MTAPGWERRLLERWLADTASRLRLTATEAGRHARESKSTSLYTRGLTVFGARYRAAAELFAAPLTEEEWPSESAPRAVVGGDRDVGNVIGRTLGVGKVDE